MLSNARFLASADGLPSLPGAYVLRIDLSHAVALPPRFGDASLEAGVYWYCGSAYGPGGIRARCARHLRRGKTHRWHVDWLTNCATEVQAAAFSNAIECDLVDAALASGATIPLPGFGSSDCRRCASHLLALPRCSEN